MSPKHNGKKRFYLTDSIHKLNYTRRHRELIFSKKPIKNWSKAKIKIIETKENELILKIGDFEIMASYQLEYMRSLAETVCKNGGNILNIGYGLGILDWQIEKLRNKYPIKNHYIVELNEDLYKHAKIWQFKETFADKIIIHLGNWKDVLMEFKKNNLIFDGIVYDGFPLTKEEIHRDSIDFITEICQLKLLKEDSGILTFFADVPDEKLGSKFTNFLYSLGFARVETEKIKITPPKRKRPNWKENFFLTPNISAIDYSKSPVLKKFHSNK